MKGSAAAGPIEQIVESLLDARLLAILYQNKGKVVSGTKIKGLELRGLNLSNSKHFNFCSKNLSVAVLLKSIRILLPVFNRNTFLSLPSPEMREQRLHADVSERFSVLQRLRQVSSQSFRQEKRYRSWKIITISEDE